MLRFRFSNILFDKIRYLGFPEKQIVSRNMLNNLNANRQSKRTVKHDKLYPMQTTVKITNITIPSKVRLRLDQIFEITYLGKPVLGTSVNDMQIRNKDTDTDPPYYGIATDTYYYGTTDATNPHDYLILYTNLTITAQIDINRMGVLAVGGGGGGGKDTGNSSESSGGGGGGAYVFCKLNVKAHDELELTIGEGGRGGGSIESDTNSGSDGGTTTVKKYWLSGLYYSNLPSWMIGINPDPVPLYSYTSASGGKAGNGEASGMGGEDIVSVTISDDFYNWRYFYGGKGGDEAPGNDSICFASDYSNEVPYPEDVKEAINNFFKSNVQNSVATDYTSYGGGGGGAGSQDESQYWTNGSGAINGDGGARGVKTDSNSAKGPGTPGFNGGGGGAGADNGHYGGNGGKGLVIIYVESQYTDQY
jgi:hypothetical protein